MPLREHRPPKFPTPQPSPDGPQTAAGEGQQSEESGGEGKGAEVRRRHKAAGGACPGPSPHTPTLPWQVCGECEHEARHEDLGPATKRAELYLAKGIGRDMLLKATVYTLRMLTLYATNNPARMNFLQTMILNIIDCRMLHNAVKWPGTLKSCMEKLFPKKTEANAMSPSISDRGSLEMKIRLVTGFSFFCRSFEQFSGDLGYIQKNILTKQWTRERISWHYKFYKSWGLLLSAMSELLKIYSFNRKLKQARDVLFSVDTSAFESAASPALGTMAKQQVQFPQQQQVDVCELRRQRWRSFIFLLRNIADMTVYFQWVSWYHPWKHLEYSCGIFSGLSGIYLVWQDTTCGDTKKSKSGGGV